MTYQDFFDPVDDKDDLVANDVEDDQEEEVGSATEEQNEESMSEWVYTLFAIKMSL